MTIFYHVFRWDNFGFLIPAVFYAMLRFFPGKFGKIKEADENMTAYSMINLSPHDTKQGLYTRSYTFPNHKLIANFFGAVHGNLIFL